MKKTPLIIAVVCGLLAFIFFQRGNLPSNENNSPIIEKTSVEQVLTDSTATAEDLEKFNSVKMEAMQVLADDNYDWQEEYRLKVNVLLHCINTKGEFDHNIYSFNNGQEKCLIVVCHGWTDGNRYGILMHERFREDYIQAVEESLAYWTRKGLLKNTEFDYVFMTTCHCGYVPQTSHMPIFNINLNFANNNKNKNAYWEKTENGQTTLYLYRGTPRGLNSAVIDSGKRMATKEERENMTVLGNFEARRL